MREVREDEHTLPFFFERAAYSVEPLQLCAPQGLAFEPMETSYFVSRQKIVPTEGGGVGMALWRDRLFAMMARNAGDVTDYFNIPDNRVIELGTRVQI